MNLVYSTIHRRVLSEALAEAAGVALPAVALPDAAPGAHERSFAIALDDIRDTIVPRLADQQAAVKPKAPARPVKGWRANRSEEHKSELQHLRRTTYAVMRLNKKQKQTEYTYHYTHIH